MTEPAEYEDFQYASQDGLTLAGRKYGWDNPPDRLPVLCLAGLTRNSADFHELALHLAGGKNGRRVLTLDYRGRGRSGYDRNWQNYNVITEAEDTIAGVVAAGLEEVAVVGTSRGGLIAMVLAAMRPAMLKAAVFNDIGPEIDGPGLVRIRQMLEETRGNLSSWQEAAGMLERIGKKHFPSFSAEDWMKQARLIYTERDGKIVRDYDPNLAKTMMSIDLDVPIPTLWPQFHGLTGIPFMLIRGENTDLLSQDCVSKMRQHHPAMTLVNVPDQGHAPDLGTSGLPARIARFVESADLARH